MNRNYPSSTRRETMPNEAVISKPIPFPSLLGTDETLPTRLPWYIRCGVWVGTLMVKPDVPKGWGVNPSVITLCILIAGIIASGAYYIGHQAAMLDQMQERMNQVDAKAEDAHTKATYAISKSDGGDGHEQSNTAKVKPKGKPPKSAQTE